MIFVTIVQIIGTIPMFLAIPMSAMMFDSPGSMDNNNVWLMFCTVVSLPFVIILLNIMGWLFWVNEEYAVGSFLILIGFVIESIVYGALYWVLRS